ncbi:MAG: 5-(carboxyamino)imidazole ribonucleotide synthase [Proteobacteria bacterium]|nr:5-(carboxyamino)imidazole ribonucleotide synthase [Pseudomonadota bacterium]
MVLPGATLGMLGGGQLGRMFVHAATAMGYRVIVLDPSPASPAGEIAQVHLQADYDDERALDELARECSVVTTEFENVPAQALQYLQGECRVYPSPDAVGIAQSRIREKQHVQSLGIPCTAFQPVCSDQDIRQAFEKIGSDLILKTARFGYDGKGQATVGSIDQAIEAWEGLDKAECILEKRIDLQTEISSVLARSSAGETSFFGIAENVHRNGILFTSTAPASVDEAIQDLARSHASKIAEDLDYCGVLAIEYFVDKSNNLYFNEMAPRTHNSGHYTIDACYTSQFEQQVRAVCGLSLGSTVAHSAVTMVNLLGDLWQRGEPRWNDLIEDTCVKLHLYGKTQARPGRKMGHFCVLAPPGENTRDRAEQLFSRL